MEPKRCETVKRVGKELGGVLHVPCAGLVAVLVSALVGSFSFPKEAVGTIRAVHPIVAVAQAVSCPVGGFLPLYSSFLHV